MQIEELNISNIFYELEVVNKIPAYFKNKENPIISYKYSPTIAPKIFNFKDTVKSFDPTSHSSSAMTYNCLDSEYFFSAHGHIITGDLSFVKNTKVRNLLLKGPKFREQNYINWDKDREILYNALDAYALNWAKREEEPPEVLTEWLDSIKTILEKRIIKIRDTIKPVHPKTLNNPSVIKYLKKLHEDFVLVPADKAVNNIIIVCKKLYYEINMEELGIGRPSTYASVLSTLQDRDYVILEKRRFTPDSKGRVVTSFLESFFNRYVEYDFTANLEQQLDQISAGDLQGRF